MFFVFFFKYAVTISTVKTESSKLLIALSLESVKRPLSRRRAYVRFRLSLSHHAPRGLQYIIDKEKEQGQRKQQQGLEEQRHTLSHTLGL